MPAIGLSEAAKLTGRSASTIHRAMKRGRLAYAVGEDGERRIDVAELERVYGAIASDVGRHDALLPEIAALNRLLDDRNATIRDLRGRLDAAEQRLDASEVERRATQTQLHALLTGPRRSWWRWWR